MQSPITQLRMRVMVEDTIKNYQNYSNSPVIQNYRKIKPFMSLPYLPPRNLGPAAGGGYSAPLPSQKKVLGSLRNELSAKKKVFDLLRLIFLVLFSRIRPQYLLGSYSGLPIR